MVSPDSPSPKWSRRPTPPVTKSSTAWRFILIAVCAFALGFATYRFFLQDSQPALNANAPAVTTPPSEESGRRISLFYPLADGNGLASIIRKRPACLNDAMCLEDLLFALSENPGGGLFPLLTLSGAPPTAVIEGATATINFRRETIQQLPGGVQSERLVLAGLVNTLAVNYPQVQQLAIEIDGLPAETLKGHIDLSTPFLTDFSLVRRPLLPSYPVKSGPPSQRSL
ncbi:MAG: GerMN domain-containing protein [Desulfuromonadales bacterium]|nr:GerMN domain-containing protein [Desulfuromonadales bacterium]